MIHTYIAPTASAVVHSASLVTVTWPSWVEAVAADVTPLDE
jgi:hypothetical protein